MSMRNRGIASRSPGAEALLGFAKASDDLRYS